MECPYCSAENADEEVFCTECGRPLKKQEKKKKEIAPGKYRVDANTVNYLSKTNVEIIDNVKDVVCFPNAQRYIDGKYALIFNNQRGISLADYMKQTSKIQGNVIRSLGDRIIYILDKIQKKNFLVGSCDFDDFFLIDNNPEKMVLRAVRPLLRLKNVYIPQDYECGEFAAPEIKNGDLDRVKKNTDVYLAALIFNRLLIGDRYIAGDIESQLFWAYNYTNSAFGNNYRKYHHWLGKCLSMFPEKRLRDTEACLRTFEKCSGMEDPSDFDTLHISYALETHVGSGKKAIMQSAGRDKSKWNEDAIERWENADKGFTAYLLADGISNCDIGSGYMASNTIRRIFIQVLKENINDDFDDLTYDLVEQMAYQIVERSNEAIWEDVLKSSETKGNIMGSTFIFLVVYEGGLYYYSIGDSPLYLIRSGNMIPLNSPDNVGFQALLSGKSYAEYRKMEGKDNIAIYVGGEYARKQSQYYTERSVETIALKPGDIVIASSDGIIDYYGTKISDTKWEKENALASKLINRKKSLKERAQAIIRRDNKNGGGDNLSVILIEVEGGKNNE